MIFTRGVCAACKGYLAIASTALSKEDGILALD
jgi:hypothetical protein